MKANHNDVEEYNALRRCFQQCKVTKMKANHNYLITIDVLFLAVSNNIKLLK